jgi:hypothetical protein
MGDQRGRAQSGAKETSKRNQSEKGAWIYPFRKRKKGGKYKIGKSREREVNLQ